MRDDMAVTCNLVEPGEAFLCLGGVVLVFVVPF